MNVGSSAPHLVPSTFHHDICFFLKSPARARCHLSMKVGHPSVRLSQKGGQLIPLQRQRFHGAHEPSKSDSHQQSNVWLVPRQSFRDERSCERRSLPSKGFFPLRSPLQLPSYWEATPFSQMKLAPTNGVCGRADVSSFMPKPFEVATKLWIMELFVCKSGLHHVPQPRGEDCDRFEVALWSPCLHS